MPEKELILVSACLAGLKTRYDGRIIGYPPCTEELQRCRWIPVCPEQLGGLATPRPPADIIGGDGDDVLDGNARVCCTDGTDVTAAFIEGARQVLAIAQQQAVSTAFLKARSPSCGITRLGVAAALLRRHGCTVIEFG